ncbi:four helix bundle protein [uncultured Bacteroides sp.]|uniref:four helix bundle protein n=1 Tax=uncultured Bacteroides sp. TaxID=162156 RepID=UPI0025E4B67B|nr:four helix bundle protein [uncultured Bacteroides sp.]
MEAKNSVLKDKSKMFAVRMVKLYIHKYAIAQKECNEALYWLQLLYATTYLTLEEYNSIYFDAEKLMNLLTASIRTAKANRTVNH